MNSIPSYPDAIAYIRGENQVPVLCGQVKFYQKKNHVIVSVNIKGLPPSSSGFYGFHIHEGNSCEGHGFPDTGTHYNPAGISHPSHPGDLPPLMLCGGGARQTVATDRFQVVDVIGRTVVIHSMPDDFTSQPAGNAGTKIGCGVIVGRKKNHF